MYGVPRDAASVTARPQPSRREGSRLRSDRDLPVELFVGDGSHKAHGLPQCTRTVRSAAAAGPSPTITTWHPRPACFQDCHRGDYVRNPLLRDYPSDEDQLPGIPRDRLSGTKMIAPGGNDGNRPSLAKAGELARDRAAGTGGHAADESQPFLESHRPGEPPHGPRPGCCRPRRRRHRRCRYRGRRLFLRQRRGGRRVLSEHGVRSLPGDMGGDCARKRDPAPGRADDLDRLNAIPSWQAGRSSVHRQCMIPRAQTAADLPRPRLGPTKLRREAGRTEQQPSVHRAPSLEHVALSREGRTALTPPLGRAIIRVTNPNAGEARGEGGKRYPQSRRARLSLSQRWRSSRCRVPRSFRTPRLTRAPGFRIAS